jgi:hypothetical protein
MVVLNSCLQNPALVITSNRIGVVSQQVNHHPEILSPVVIQRSAIIDLLSAAGIAAGQVNP